MSAICHRLCVRHLYLAKVFFWEERIGLTYCHVIIHSCCIKKQIMKTKGNFKKLTLIWNHILRILPTSTLHVSLVRCLNSEFPSSLENLWDFLRRQIISRSREVTSFGSNQNSQQPPLTLNHLVNPPIPLANLKDTWLYHTLSSFHYSNHDHDRVTLAYFGTIALPCLYMAMSDFKDSCCNPSKFSHGPSFLVFAAKSWVSSDWLMSPSKLQHYLELC
jgi:hypothetical protein